MRAKLLGMIAVWVVWLLGGVGPLGVSFAAGEKPLIRVDPEELKIANRSIFTFHASLLGESPETRARRAEAVIEEVLARDENHEVRLDAIQDSYMILIGDRRALIVSPKDVTTIAVPVRQIAEEAAERLRLVANESAQAKSPRFLLTAAGLTILSTLIFVLLLRLVYWLRNKVSSRLPSQMRKHTAALKIGQTQLLDISNLYTIVRRLISLLYWTLALLITYEWLTFVLQQFPYTRPWGESLNQYLFRLVRFVMEAVVDSIPGLVIALIIFFIARGFSTFSKRLLERVARPGTISWLTRETLLPTIRLTSLGIWLFALAMAYPYLPGADTEAFKGLSILIGLMVSLGASSVVGQAAAGLILTYTDTLRPGEYVRIGEHEGTITELGTFTTSIRTGLGEVLTLPNSMITGSVTKNYSRAVQGPGYVVDTVVTIGYDTPWRQVEAMLLEAARRTPGVLMEPHPRVFQTALSDFYPEYRLVAQAVPSEPLPRAELLSLLHANILDVFNEYGVQIMSPHYLGDPESEKLVPEEKWYSVPACAPKTVKEK